MEALQATPGQPDTAPCPRLPMLRVTNQDPQEGTCDKRQ